MGTFSRHIKNICQSYRSFSKIAFMERGNPIVTISEGKLRGTTHKLYDGSTYSFKGIPYSEPPIGKLRFKDPKPHQGWLGICDAIEHGNFAHQVEIQTATVKEGNEDCFFLNVYTQSLQPSSKIPVIVFIHGGAFMAGSGDSSVYGPKFLLKHDVILVTLNYRLEAFGFLSLDTPEIPGNAGLKDQVVALRWVQRNIAVFGGDPDNVIVFGENAGGASVTYHLLSPITDGLFHKAIIQSGVCVTDWAIDKDAKSRAFRVGEHFGKKTNSPDELLELLQGIPSVKLINISAKCCTKDERFRGLPIYFSPVVENKFKNIETYLSDDPVKLLQEGKAKNIPTIVGYNSAEGLVVANIIFKQISVK